MKVDLNFGGLESGKTIVKIALAMCHQYGIILRDFNSQREYLQGKNQFAPFGYYSDTDIVKNRPVDNVLHVVSLISNKNESLLLCYIELFSIHRAIVILSESWNGPDINVSYAICPTTGEEYAVEVSLDFQKEDIQKLYNYELLDHEKQAALCSKSIEIGTKIQQEKAMNEAFKQAFIKTCKELGIKEGEEVKAEIAWEFSDLLTKNIWPHIQHVYKFS